MVTYQNNLSTITQEVFKMNGKVNHIENQEVKEGIAKKTRAQYRREEKADRKKTKAGFKMVGSVLSGEEIERRKQDILASLKSRTWRDLETKG